MFYESKETSFFIVNERSQLEYPLHVHQYIEVVHVVEGKTEMQIGSEKYLVNTGEIGVIFPNIPHDYHTLSPTGKTQLHIMNCYVDLIPMLKTQLLGMYPQTPVLHKEQIHEDVPYAEHRLFETARHYGTRTPPPELISSLVTLLLTRLFPYLHLTDYQESLPQDLTCNILAYISKHFTEEISLSSIGAVFGIGKYAVSRIFSNILKVSFLHYINSLRIDYAKYLLLNTDLSITNIAMECGYHSQQTFNRVFKELCSCTPKEYKKIHYENTGFSFGVPTSF